MKNIALWTLGCLLMPAVAVADPPAEVLKREEARIQAINKAADATVAVVSGGGSGVLISADGYALTNYHVTGTNPALKCGLNDGKLYDAVLVSSDPVGDLSLIKLLGRDDFPYAKLADSDEVQAGDWCFAGGNPFGLADDYTPSMSYGIVSGVHRYQKPSGLLLEYGDCIQLDAAGNPGNSGGPTFNMRGEIIGINGRISLEKRGRVNVGVTYAISANQCKKFLGVMKSGRIVDHSSLGATVSTDTQGRVFINDVDPKGDAYRRGLRYGDIVTKFAGRDIRSVNAFQNALTTYPSDWRVPVVFRRNGKEYSTLVKLCKLHQPNDLEKMFRAQPVPALPKGAQPKSDPNQPAPAPGPAPAAPREREALPFPKVVSDNYEARALYVNFHFNKVNQDRVWKAFQAHGDFATAPTHWVIEGELAEGGQAKLDVTNEMASITMPDGESKVDYLADLIEQPNPPGSGGLLVALHMWRRFITVGPEKFGEMYYMGTMPLPNSHKQDQMVDVLVGKHQGIESIFFFDPTNGNLVGLEATCGWNVDPCEIYFSDFQKVEGRDLPFHWDVRSGNSTFAVLNVKKFSLSAPVEK